MEKYNYDFIADQEPDGNSEWYPAKEVDKAKEQWRREKEWLLNELLPVYVRDIPGIHKPEITDESLKDLIIKQMNEALGG